MKTLIFLIFLIFPKIAMSYETAQYEVTKVISDKIEIRNYKELVLATKSQNAKGSKNSNFRALFKFISGENKQDQEIKMTTPVFKQNIDSDKTMSFVLPKNFNKKNTPQPSDQGIKIEFLKNVNFIAIEFSGRSTQKNFNKYQAILEKEIKNSKINADLSNPINAYYNSPWTLPFLKRNEVLFRVI
jgi:hypothetical protein